MAKLIKKGSLDLGEVEPESGFPQTTQSKKVISGRRFDAKAEAEAIIQEARQEAEQIVAQAQAQAQQALEQAQGEAEQLKAQAEAQGIEEGRAAGAAQLTEAVAQASQQMEVLQAQLEPQLKELAVSIARKILGRELEFHPEGVVDIIKQALNEKARQRREIFLRVNPEDLATVRESKADLLEVLSRCKEIGIREDPDVARYGVIIETDAGLIDAQLETQLAVLERVLKNTR